MQAYDQKNYDYLVKVIIIGDSGVGKTNILLRFIENQFKTDHMATLGVDFKMKTLEIGDKILKMQIWDTAGQDRFKTITQSYYKGASGIILTYAINDRTSFEHIRNWMKQIEDHASENIVKILVANKTDAERRVEKTEGSHLASEYNMQFIEVSAKEDYQISTLFQELGRMIINKISSDGEFAQNFKKPKQVLAQKNTNSSANLQEQSQSGGCSC